ncbi:TetR/AcrR family transcriptional regulator [Roseovarius sp. D22-M7]|uniref:TetR/AcrR family transcriptional regulator n=1 Tax=Roseovarius sp. D22-M7 TaxID=3127116 RepID=UPI00300F90DC
MGRSATHDRDDVLHAAMDLFWARGYRNTSLKDLERTLDMRPGSIYAAFGSKQALFCAALDRYAAIGKATLAEAIVREPSPISGLAAHVRMIGRLLSSDPPSRACMLVKTLLETPDDDPMLRQPAEKMIREVEMTFADAFRHARDAGEIPPGSDPERLAARLQASIFGLRAYAQRKDAAETAGILAEDIAREIEALAG